MYLVFITLAMCVIYFILLALFPFFFTQKATPLQKKSLLPVAYIIAFSVLAYAASFSIADLELGNRVLHAFGGGFLGFLVCFLAARNSKIHINRFQFFMFSALVVLSLGIANELLEFLLQEYSGFLFAASTSIYDTWLDLASNVAGVIIAGVCLVPFHTRHYDVRYSRESYSERGELIPERQRPDKSEEESKGRDTDHRREKIRAQWNLAPEPERIT